MKPHCYQCERLGEENERLRQHLEAFRPQYPQLPGLTRTEGAMLEYLAKHISASYQALCGVCAFYGNQHEISDRGRMHVSMVYLRRYCRILGIEIQSLPKFGYVIVNQDVAKRLLQRWHANDPTLWDELSVITRLRGAWRNPVVPRALGTQTNEGKSQ